MSDTSDSEDDEPNMFSSKKSQNNDDHVHQDDDDFSDYDETKDISARPAINMPDTSDIGSRGEFDLFNTLSKRKTHVTNVPRKAPKKSKDVQLLEPEQFLASTSTYFVSTDVPQVHPEEEEDEDACALHDSVEEIEDEEDDDPTPMLSVFQKLGHDLTSHELKKKRRQRKADLAETKRKLKQTQNSAMMKQYEAENAYSQDNSE